MTQNSAEQCREHIAQIAHLIYDRRLSDSAGGNISERGADGNIYMSPRYCGSRLRWQLRPEHILTVTPDGQILAGDGELTREVQMHLAIYRQFSNCNGICHAHPYNVLVFACAERALPPTSEQTEKYGVIPLAAFAPAHSPDLAGNVIAALEPQRAKLARHAIACILPRHGITVAGRNLDDAYDALERLDGSAKIWIDRAALATIHLETHACSA